MESVAQALGPKGIIVKPTYILSAARTPIGKLNGAYANVPAVELGSIAIREAVNRAGIDVGRIDEVLMGNVLQAGEGQNYGAPPFLAQWYARNFNMAHNLTRLLRPDVRRVLVVVGSGHVPPLRNLLGEAPQFCPVSPLSLLR